jgi:hypothetical protein
MKRIGWLLAAVALVLACSRHHGINTGPLASSFRTAEPTLKTQAEAAVQLIREGKLPEALTELQKLSNRARLSAEQQQVVKDTIQQIQTKLEADAKKTVPKIP